MAENDAGERSEQPTGKKLQKAREDGQVARSKELNSASLLIVSGLIFIGAGGHSASGIISVLMENFQSTREQIFDTSTMLTNLSESLEQSFFYLAPILLTFFITAAVAPISLGGFNFSWKSAAPKLNKFSPMKGFKRMFGLNAGMELLKSVGKFAVVGSFSLFYLGGRFDEFLSLGHGDVNVEIVRGIEILIHSFLVIALSLLIIVAIDVPYQIWNHTRQLKMTKQEVKDETMDAEGRPEVKGHIRNTQRELAQRRMMAEVPKADVVITNPEHFAVALKYGDEMIAPVVVAKGADQIALKIREIAKEYDVPIFTAPPLARAVFYSTKLEQPIPEGLYLAVAQVLAYVFQLKEHRKGEAKRPADITDLPIPENLKW